MTARVLVVGAGAAGLAAASSLAARGVAVTVVDKGRGVGGRMATRRIGTARVDHGAQFFTVRSAALRPRCADWLARGVVREWCRGFRTPSDGHPRYVGATGMTAPAEDLASGLDVRTGTRLRALRVDAAGWSAVTDVGEPLRDAGGRPLRADAVVATAPVPQTLALLDAGGAGLRAATRSALEAISYSPTLAALAVLAAPPAIPPPGGVQLDDGPISWVGDNQAKGISPVPAVTVHAGAEESSRRWSDNNEATLSWLLRSAEQWIGDARVVEAQLARWRYAAPVVLHHEACLVAGEDPLLVCAGDAFGQARVEGALLSGRAAAGAVADRLAA